MSIDLREAMTPDVLDLVTDSVTLRDVAGRVLTCTSAATRRYGPTTEQALARKADQMLNTQHGTPLSGLEAMLLVKRRWHGRLTRTTAGGAELVVDARWQLQNDASDKP